MLLPVLLAMCGPTRAGYSPDTMEDVDDLMLKNEDESDTDESDSGEETNKAPVPEESRGSMVDDSARSLPPRPATILHSESTVKEECFEVIAPEFVFKYIYDSMQMPAGPNGDDSTRNQTQENRSGGAEGINMPARELRLSTMASF